jgi:hypothetical protein
LKKEPSRQRRTHERANASRFLLDRERKEFILGRFDVTYYNLYLIALCINSRETMPFPPGQSGHLHTAQQPLWGCAHERSGVGEPTNFSEGYFCPPLVPPAARRRGHSTAEKLYDRQGYYT